MSKKQKIPYEILIAALLNVAVILIVCLFAGKPNISPPRQVEIEVDVSNFTPKKPEIIQKKEISSETADGTETTGVGAIKTNDEEFSKQAMQSSLPHISNDSIKPGSTVSERRSELDKIVREMQGFDGKSKLGGTVGSSGGSLPAGHQVGESFKGRGDSARRGQLLKRYGGDIQSEGAVEKALKFLASVQNSNGSWGGKESFKTGDAATLSSLALLAFFAHGESFDSKLYAEKIRKGADFLVSIANEPNIEYAGSGFGHAILTYALAERYAVSGSLSLKKPLEERLKSMIERQNKFGSFSPNYDNSPQAPPTQEQSENPLSKEIITGEPACDLSLLGWHIQAMTASRNAGIHIDGLDKALELANEALIKIHQAEKGGFSQGINMKRFPANDNMTPVGLLGLQLLNFGTSTPAHRAQKAMQDEKSNKIPLPSWKKSLKFPLYQWYYQTQALFQAEKGQGNLWNDWNENLKKELTANQQSDGSWSLPAGDSSFRLKDKKDLTVYSTSLCALILQVYYRYLPNYSIAESANMNKNSADDLDMGMSGLITRLPGGADPMASVILGIGVNDLQPIRFGKFDGQPQSNKAQHLPDEFPVYASFKSTILVRKTEDWPQTLQPNQRIAIFCDELLPQNFKGHLRLSLAIVGESSNAVEESPSIEAVINGKRLYNSFLLADRQLVELLIPSDYFQQFGNIIQIRNNGKSILAFDAAEIGAFTKVGKCLYLGAENLEDLPVTIKSSFNTGIIPIEEDYDGNAIVQQINRVKFTGAVPVLSIKKLDAEKFGALIKDFNTSIPIWELPISADVKTVKEMNPDVKVVNSISLCSTTENKQLLGNLKEYSSDNEYWASWESAGSEYMGKEFQLHYLRQTGREIIDWIAGGGTAIYLKDIMSGGRLFDSVFKTEYPAAAALRQAAKLFEGNPHKLPAQVYPTVGDKPSLYSSAAASYNAPGVATVVIAKRFPFPVESEVLALLPWSGETQMTVERGFFDKDSPYIGMAGKLTNSTHNINVENNIFKYSGVFPELTVIRLVRKGSKPLVKQPSAERYIPPDIKFDYHLVKVKTPEMPSPFNRHPIRNARDFAARDGQNVSFQTVPATPDSGKGKFQPVEKQSILLNFKLNENRNIYDSIFLQLQNGPSDISFLSFNVYTRITSTSKRDEPFSVPLRFSLGGRCFQTILPLNRWQRVMLKLDGNNKSPYWQSIRFLEPGRIPHDKVTDVSYEINDVAVLK